MCLCVVVLVRVWVDVKRRSVVSAVRAKSCIGSVSSLLACDSVLVSALHSTFGPVCAPPFGPLQVLCCVPACTAPSARHLRLRFQVGICDACASGRSDGASPNAACDAWSSYAGEVIFRPRCGLALADGSTGCGCRLEHCAG